MSALDASAKLAEKMLQGYAMVQESCGDCNVPLMRTRDRTRTFSVCFLWGSKYLCVWCPGASAGGTELRGRYSSVLGFIALFRRSWGMPEKDLSPQIAYCRCPPVFVPDCAVLV